MQLKSIAINVYIKEIHMNDQGAELARTGLGAGLTPRADTLTAIDAARVAPRSRQYIVGYLQKFQESAKPKVIEPAPDNKDKPPVKKPVVKKPKPPTPEPPKPPIDPEVPKLIPVEDHPLSAKDPVQPESPKPPAPPVAPILEPLPQPEVPPQPEPVEEESWQPQQERKTNHPFYQDMNEGEDPNSPKWESIKTEMAKKKNGELYGHQEVIDNMNVVSELLKNDEVKKMFPKKSGENEDEYNNRLLHNVMTRLRFHGEYGHKKDPLYVFLQQQLKDAKGDVLRWDEILMGAEAIDGLAMEKKVKAYEQEMYNLNFSGARRSVLTEVFLIGDERRAGGGTDRYFGKDQQGNLARKELPQMDLYAFEMVGQIVMDVGDPTLGTKPDGKPVTYAENFKYLQNIILNPTSTAEDKKNASLKLVNAREQFYINVLNVLGHRHEHNPYRDESVFRKESHTKLRGLLKGNAADTVESLLQAYEKAYENYHGQPLTDRQRQRFNILRTLPNADIAGHPQDVLDFALKGGDLMRRRAKKLKEPPPKPPREIYRKKLRQAGIYRGRLVEEEEAESTVTPPSPEPAPKSPDGQDGTGPGKEGENPPTVPAPGDRSQTPSPGEDGGPLEELASEKNFGAAGLTDRRVQNVLQSGQHLFADDLRPETKSNWYKFRDKALGWSYRIPLAGGVVRGLVHPVQMIWQNGLARSVFEQQWIRFSSDAQDILKGASDKTVPVDVNPELLEKALEEGRKEKAKRNLFKQLAWKATDTLQGLTGIGQTSEQRMAKNWLKEQVQKTVDQRDVELQTLSKRSLEEQNRLGDRYARFDRGLGLDKSNRAVLAKDAGETRHQLPEQLDKQVNEKLKGFIAQYASGSLTEEQLVKEANTYLLGDFRNSLSADQQKEFSAPEAASNILSIARYVTGKGPDGAVIEANRWQRFQQEKVESGQTKWEEFHLNVLFGKSEWGGARGKVEMGLIADRLARRLAERPNLWDKAGGGAWAMAKDLTTNGAFFAAGYGASALTFGASMPLRMVGGFVGMGVGAGLKETGIGLSALGIKGIKGRYVKEVEQLSREVARGREDQADARIRPEMKKALVTEQMRDATTLTQTIEDLLRRETLSVDEAKKLLFALADADARMRLTDLSGSRKNNFKVQNYIKFNEGRENDEYDRLKGSVLNGMVKLSTSGQTVLLDSLDKYSAVAEAQLRFSSDDAKQIKKWLSSEAHIPANEVDTMMQDLNLHVQKGESLKGKQKTLFWLTIKRGASTMVRAAATGVVAPLVYAPVTQSVSELGNVLQHVQHSGWNVGTGLNEWSQSWNDTLRGVPPVDIDPSGNLVSMISPLQRSTIWVENIIHPPVWTPHDTAIDGGSIQLPGELNYVDKVDASGNHHYGIMDIRNGTVSNLRDPVNNVDFHLGLRDIDGDGKLDLAILDKAGNPVSNDPNFAGNLVNVFGIKVVPGAETITSTNVEILPLPGAGHPPHIETLTIDPTHQVPVSTPDGAAWVQDGTGWDLVTVKPDGTQVNLIDNVTIQPNGQIDLSHATNHYPAVLSIDNGAPIRISGGSGTEGGSTVSPDFWQTHGTKIDHREWYSYDKPGSQENELRMYNSYETNADGSHTVILDMSKMHEAHQSGLTPNPINVQDVIKNQNIADPSRGEQVGFYFSLPGHSKEGIFIRDIDDGVLDGQVRLDPTDTVHQITFPDGNSITLGEFSKMLINEKALSTHIQDAGLGPNGGLATEWRGWQDVFQLSDGKTGGFIEAGRMVEQNGHLSFQAFATIKGDAPVSSPEIPPIDVYHPTVNLSGPITEVVETKTSTFALEAPPGLPFGIDWLPIPSRQNIEKSEKGAAPNILSSSTPQPQPTGQAQSTAQAPPVAKPEGDKQEREEHIANELRKHFTKERQEKIIEEERKKLPKEESDLEKKVGGLLEANPTVMDAINKRYTQAIQGKPESEWNSILAPIFEDEFKKANILLTAEEFFKYRKIKNNLQEKLANKISEEEAKIRKEIEEKEKQTQNPTIQPKPSVNPQVGSESEATPIILDGKPSAYEIYSNPQRPGVPWLRKTSPSAPDLEAISPNGSTSYVNGEQGQVISEDWNFRLGGKFYLVKDGQFVEISDASEIKKIEERIKKHQEYLQKGRSGG